MSGGDWWEWIREPEHDWLYVPPHTRSYAFELRPAWVHLHTGEIRWTAPGGRPPAWIPRHGAAVCAPEGAKE